FCASARLLERFRSSAPPAAISPGPGSGSGVPSSSGALCTRNRGPVFNRLYGVARASGLFGLLLAVVAVSLAVNHQRTRSFLLGWVLFLNMPLFFVVFSSGGRFYSAAGVSLVVAAVPLLFERGFYKQMARYPWR